MHQLCLGQSPRAAHWYFGAGAGIDFSTGTAVSDPGSQMNSLEGCATISDLSGHLLFYTNGQKVWNRNHAVMAGGDLSGDPSSTESSLIVPLPGSDHLYYLFTTIGGSASSTGMYYTIVDMNLSGGSGGITSMKNIPLFTPGTEQLAGTQHCNSTDYWIMGRQNVEGVVRFYAYLLTKDGLSNPVVSEFKLPNHTYNTVGSISFSQDGSIMTFTSFGMDTYVFDFSTTTGALSLKTSIGRAGGEEVYSNAISPDNTKLYTTSVANAGFNYLTQYDLTAANITASRVNIDSVDFRHGSPNSFGYIGQIRLAPDQQIYVSRWNQDHPYQIDPDTKYSLDSIDVIHQPNLKGMASLPQRNYLYLHGRPTMLGLPNFISNYTSPIPTTTGCPVDPGLVDFAVSGECKGLSLVMTYTGPSNIASLSWNFGDPASGADNTSTSMNPTHLYPREGDYLVNLTVNYTGGAVTKTKTVRALTTSDVQLGNDTILCEKQSLVLHAPGSIGVRVQWQDNSSRADYVVHEPGKYFVTVSEKGCVASDTILVDYKKLPGFSLGPDQSICGNEKILLTARILTDTSSLGYEWQNGSSEKTFIATLPGSYILRVTNSCGTSSDTVRVVEGFCTVHLPSAFTPNGDGHNDLFRATGDHVTQFRMVIYNRWGQKVCASGDIGKGWD
ncbi:MAG TPA: PKD domain-containing protein, partial [Puia sp.]|nr:PKD domain-containing protein [Puia sp.]